jgi:hypothetical protein
MVQKMNKKCPFCDDKNKKSVVMYTGFSKNNTSIKFGNHWDEDGGFHHHNPNKQCFLFKCSNGHKWQEKWFQECPSCDYYSNKPVEIVVLEE